MASITQFTIASPLENMVLCGPFQRWYGHLDTLSVHKTRCSEYRISPLKFLSHHDAARSDTFIGM